ncbi:MAG: acyl-ACP--UDP-N-acetylglucosamine O-acyltransferase [Elusimicrobia bacterium]|nr:acyl-ACP--UDP-N-acetylglucosamine O-acyltransferase [Elusimicrobiota bacterium]
MTVTTAIHPTAVVHPCAEIADGVEIAPYAVIGEEVRIGKNTTIGPHAIVEFTTLGENCRVFSHAIVGTAPQDLKYKGEPTRLVLGNNVTVRECVTLNRGSAATGETRIADNCLFMAYSHVAHDCRIGRGVILANATALAGHVEVGDYAVLSTMIGVHQFVRIGKLAMLGGGAMVSLDIPPYCIAQGDRAHLFGLNLVGLRRAGLPKRAIEQIKQVYRMVFESTSRLEEIVKKLQDPAGNLLPAPDGSPWLPEAAEMIRFLSQSSRGLTRPRRQQEA